MKDYRDVLKEHFGSRSPWKSLLGIDYVFYGVGLLFLILSACLMNTYGVWYDMFGTLGLLCVVFGLFLAFIKKDEWGMLITTGVCALYYLVMFIVIAVQSSRYIGLLQISELLYALVFGGLFALALMTSSVLKMAKQRRAVTMQANNSAVRKCSVCGAPMKADAMFCPNCGAKQEKPKCPSCGAPVSENDSFCNNCGTKLK